MDFFPNTRMREGKGEIKAIIKVIGEQTVPISQRADCSSQRADCSNQRADCSIREQTVPSESRLFHQRADCSNQRADCSIREQTVTIREQTVPSESRLFHSESRLFQSESRLFQSESRLFHQRADCFIPADIESLKLFISIENKHSKKIGTSRGHQIKTSVCLHFCSILQ